MGKVFWILTGKCRKKQTNAAGQTGTPDPAGVSSADKDGTKKDDPPGNCGSSFLSWDLLGGTSHDQGFRHQGKVPVKGGGLTAAAGYIKGSNYSIMPRLFAYSVYSSYH